MGAEQAGRHAWADADWPDDVWLCLSLVTGISAADTERMFNCDERIRDCTFDEAWSMWDDESGRDHIVQISQRGPWVVAVEPGGYLGSLEEVYEPLSASGRLIGAFWGWTACQFVVADHAQTLRCFDPMFYDEQQGGHHGEPLPAETDASFSAEGLHASMLLLAERMAGMTIDRSWLLDSRAPTYFATPPTPTRRRPAPSE